MGQSRFGGLRWLSWFIVLWLPRCGLTESEYLYAAAFISSENPEEIETTKEFFETVVEEVNGRDDLLPEHRLSINISVIGCDFDEERSLAFEMLTSSENPPLALIGGGGCHGNIFPPYSQNWPILQIFYLSTILQPSGATQWEANPISVVSQLQAMHPAILSYIEINGWTEFISIHSEEYSMYTESLKISTIQKNLTIKLDIEVGSSEVEFSSSLAILKETKVRIILLHMEVSLAAQFLCSPPAVEVVGRFFWLLPAINNASVTKQALTSACDSKNLKDVLHFINIFTPSEDSQGQVILEESIQPSKIMEFVHDATYTLVHVLNQSIAKIENQVYNQIKHPSYSFTDELELVIPNIKFEGHTGTVAFADSGSRLMVTDVWRFEENGDLYLVAMTDDSYLLELVNEKSFEENFVSDIIEEITISAPVLYLNCCLGGAGICFSLFLLRFNLKHKENKMIKLTSPNINILVFCGAILSYSCIILMALDGFFEKKFEKLSLTILYALPVSFDLIYAGLASKLWRVQLIFRKTRVNRRGIKDEHLFVIVAASLLLDIIIVTTWNQLDPIKCQSYQLSTIFKAELTSDVGEMVNVCGSKFMFIWIILMALYKAVILVFCILMAWRIRNMSLPLLKEAFPIFFAVTVTSILILVFLAVSLVDRGLQPNAIHLLFSLVIFFCVSVTLSLVFIPKILIMKNLNRKNNDERFNFSSSANLAVSKGRFGCLLSCCCRSEDKDETFSADCLYKEIENTKQELKEKEKTIRELVDRLYFGPENFQKYLERRPSSSNDRHLESNPNRGQQYLDHYGSGEQERDHPFKMPKIIDSDSAIENNSPSISDSEKQLSQHPPAEMNYGAQSLFEGNNADTYHERWLIHSHERELDRYDLDKCSPLTEKETRNRPSLLMKRIHERESSPSVADQSNQSVTIKKDNAPDYKNSSYQLYTNSLKLAQKSVVKSISSVTKAPHTLAPRNIKEIYL